MTSKHTPGPWHWSDGYQTLDGRPSWTLLSETDGYGILCCDGEENSPQGLNDEANARLIAAAPELLEALILLEREMVESGNASSVDYGWKPAIEKTRAAIAKATGSA